MTTASVVKVAGIHHTSLVVGDMERSLRFYRDLLGMEVVIDTEMQGEMLDREVALQGAHLRLVELKVGRESAFLELLQYYTPAGKPFPADFRCCDTGAPHTAFLVPNIEQAYRQLMAAGVRFTAPPQDVDSGAFAGSKTVYCYDPDGIVVELWQLPGG